jgi:hypothetical protein
VIEDGIAVERTVDPARIESVDRAARTLTLSVPGFPLSTYKVQPGVLDWNGIEIGDRVRATIEESLTVYVAPAGRNRPPVARVLDVDPSYRLLTVQSPKGATETFKVGLPTRMDGIEAGDAVVIRPVEVTEIRVQGRRNRQEIRRPSHTRSVGQSGVVR